MEKIFSRFILGGVALILIAVPLAYSSSVQESFSLPKAALFQLAIAVLAVLFSLQIVIFPREAASRRTPLDFPLLIWLGWVALTSMLSLDRDESIQRLVFSACLVALFFIVTRNVRSKGQICFLVAVVAAIAAWESAYGVAERGGLKLLYESKIMEEPQGIVEGGATLPAPPGPTRGSILGTFGNANHLASYLVLAVPLLLACLALTAGALRRYAGSFRAALLACLAASLCYIVLSETRWLVTAGGIRIAFAATIFGYTALAMLLAYIGLALGLTLERARSRKTPPVIVRWSLISGLLVAVICAARSPAPLPWLTSAVLLAILLPMTGGGRLIIFPLRGVIILSLALTIACLVMIGSRGAWVAAAMGMCVLFICWFRQDLREGFRFALVAVLLLAFLVALMAVTAPQVAREIGARAKQMTTFTSGTQSYRLLTWRLSLRMIASRPLFGSGPGTFKLLFLPTLADYLRSRNPLSLWYFKEKMNEPHNEYLQTAVESGIPGLVFLLAIIILALRAAWRGVSAESVFRGALYAALLAALAAVSVHAVSSVTFSVVPTTVAFWCLLALVSCPADAAPPRLTLPRALRFGGRCAVAAVLVVFAFAVGLRTRREFLFSKHFKTATNLNHLQRYEEALDSFRRALSLKPTSGQLKFYYGSTLIHLGRNQEGAALLEESKETFQDIYLCKNLGIAYERLGRPRRALEEYRRWKEMGIASHEANNLIASLYLRQGWTGKAERIYRETLRWRPWDWSAHVTLGTLLLESGRIEEAIEVLKPRVLWRLPEAYVMYGIALLKGSQYARAEENFEHAISIDPRSVKARNNLGALYYQTGRYALAAKMWLKVLDIDPDNAIAQKNLETVKKVLRPGREINNQ